MLFQFYGIFKTALSPSLRAELVCRLVAMLREQRQLLEMRTLTSAAREEQKKKAEEMYRKVSYIPSTVIALQCVYTAGFGTM